MDRVGRRLVRDAARAGADGTPLCLGGESVGDRDDRAAAAKRDVDASVAVLGQASRLGAGLERDGGGDLQVIEVLVPPR